MMLMLLITPLKSVAWHKILKENIKSLEVILNNDFMALPIMQLNSDDRLSISFDELSHNYHRLVYHIEPCNPDWTPVEGLFESDWLEGFNDLPIEDYENSLNTNVLYTHYQMELPNDQTRLKMSGNYRIHILDNDEGGEEVACIELRVVEPLMNVGIGVTTNTDVDFQASHQQVQMTVNYNSVRVTNPNDQLQVFVLQNGREDNMKVSPKPTYVKPQGLDIAAAPWTKAARLPSLKLLRSPRKIDKSGTGVCIYSDGNAFNIAFDIKKDGPVRAIKPTRVGAYPLGDKAEISFGSGDTYWQFAFGADGSLFEAKGVDVEWKCDWTVRSEKVRGGWRAIVRIPFAAIGFDPGRDPCIRFLAMVSSTYGDSRSQVSSWTLGGGLPHSPLSWATIRVDRK